MQRYIQRPCSRHGVAEKMVLETGKMRGLWYGYRHRYEGNKCKHLKGNVESSEMVIMD